MEIVENCFTIIVKALQEGIQQLAQGNTYDLLCSDPNIGHMPKGVVLSQSTTKAPSGNSLLRTPSENPFSEPFFAVQTYSRHPFPDPSENPSPEPLPESSQNPS